MGIVIRRLNFIKATILLAFSSDLHQSNRSEADQPTTLFILTIHQPVLMSSPTRGQPQPIHTTELKRRSNADSHVKPKASFVLFLRMNKERVILHCQKTLLQLLAQSAADDELAYNVLG